MNRQNYEKIFSKERLKKYFDKYPDNEKMAIAHYHANIELSESFYPLISFFEVALRNSLNRELTLYFQAEDWYIKFETLPGLKNLKNEIQLAKKHIINRNELITSSKVIAELTLGFWVRLLNSEYELILWKSLRKSFPNLEKKQRQRKNVSAPINEIRNFRNRIFHHEPICWDLNKIEQLRIEINQVLFWLDKDLPQIVKISDKTPYVIQKIREILI